MNKDEAITALIKSAVEKGLRDSKEEPGRAFRYLLDLASCFAESQYQNELLTMLHKTLNDSENKYYQLLNKVASEIDNQTITEFGINLGYRSWISGAKTLRKSKQNLNYPDWTCFVRPKNKVGINNYNTLIYNKKKKGVFNYIIFKDNLIIDLPELISNHQDSVFSIFTQPTAINKETLKKFSSLNNIYFSVELDNHKNPHKKFKQSLNLLKEKNKLYGFHYYYNDLIAEEIINKDWLTKIKDYQSNFCCLIPDENFTDSKKVHEYVIKSRKKLKYPLFLFDLYHDLEMIGKIILTPPAWR